MFVPAMREFVAVKALVKGAEYNVDSGMGGGFPVEYKGLKDGKHVFKNKAKDWKRTFPKWEYTDAEVFANVYLLVPENPAYRIKT
jgi:hypothetical protein